VTVYEAFGFTCDGAMRNDAGLLFNPMSELQFKLLRIVAIPAALLFVADWLSLASRLQLSQATEAMVTASQGRSTPSPQCQTSGVAADTWLLHDRWIVAAKQYGQMVVTAESQVSAYREAKIMWSLGILTSVAVAAFNYSARPMSSAF
jgi:hypothetical protein